MILNYSEEILGKKWLPLFFIKTTSFFDFQYL